VKKSGAFIFMMRTKAELYFLINNLRPRQKKLLPSLEIVGRAELFLKRIRQRLKIKSF